MSEVKGYGFGASANTSPAQTNRVLRNTYFLLALSLIPTALGAWAGIQLGFFRLFAGSPIIGFIAMLAAVMGLGYLIQKNRNSPMGVVLLLGFTGVMGLMLSGILSVALSMTNGASIITMAALGTAGIFFALASYASVTKRDFSNMGKTLVVGLVMLIVASVANIFFQMPALSLTISTIAVGLFSLWLLYDLQRVMKGGETNYIVATLSIYLSLYNLFSNLLFLLMSLMGGSND